MAMRLYRIENNVMMETQKVKMVVVVNVLLNDEEMAMETVMYVLKRQNLL